MGAFGEPARSPVLRGVGEVGAVGVEVRSSGNSHFAPGVVDGDVVLGVDARDNEPVAAAGWVGGRAVVEEAAGYGDAFAELVVEVEPVAVLFEGGGDAVAGEGFDLGGGVGGVAEGQDAAQVGVVGVRASQHAGFQVGQKHGAA